MAGETTRQRRGRGPSRTTAHATFLDQLAAGCDVARAAEAAGVTIKAVHALRRRDAAFAEGWTAALALGYEMLETTLLGMALAGKNDAPAAIDVDLALKLLAARRDGRGARGRSEAPIYAAPEDTDKALMRKLDAIEKRRRIAA